MTVTLWAGRGSDAHKKIDELLEAGAKTVYFLSSQDEMEWFEENWSESLRKEHAFLFKEEFDRLYKEGRILPLLLERWSTPSGGWGIDYYVRSPSNLEVLRLFGHGDLMEEYLLLPEGTRIERKGMWYYIHFPA